VLGVPAGGPSPSRDADAGGIGGGGVRAGGRDGLRSLLTAMERRGVAASSQVEVVTLAARMESEACDGGGVVMPPPLVGALGPEARLRWSRHCAGPARDDLSSAAPGGNDPGPDRAGERHELFLGDPDCRSRCEPPAASTSTGKRRPNINSAPLAAPGAASAEYPPRRRRK
jgi:hypothetical protein